MKYLLPLIFLFGCNQSALVLHQQKMDATYLASTNIGSPDPRTTPRGQMVVAEWWVPTHLLKEDPYLKMDIIFRDFTKTEVAFPIKNIVGYETYCLLNKEFDQKKGFLSYRAEILTSKGEIFATWQHQLWVKLIEIDASESKSSAVEEKSKHPSVIEIPLCRSES